MTVKFWVHMGCVCTESSRASLLMYHLLNIVKLGRTIFDILICSYFILFALMNYTFGRFVQVFQRILGWVLSRVLFGIVASKFITHCDVILYEIVAFWVWLWLQTHLLITLLHHENVWVQFVGRLVYGRRLDRKITHFPALPYAWVLQSWLKTIVEHRKHWLFLVAWASFGAKILRNDFLFVFLGNIQISRRRILQRAIRLWRRGWAVVRLTLLVQIAVSCLAQHRTSFLFKVESTGSINLEIWFCSRIEFLLEMLLLQLLVLIFTLQILICF